jgi:hypothetical protein
MEQVMAEQAEGGDHGGQAPVHFFVHIPKCGGNTFSDFLARQFPLEKIYTAEKSTAAWEDHRRDIAARAEQLSRENKGALLRRRFIDGMRQHDLVIENHYTWDIAELLAQHRPLTTYVVVREPRERVASHYLHLRRIPVETAHELAPEGRELYGFAKEASLAEFCRTLERPDIWSTVFNRQTRTMSSQIVSRVLYEQCDKQAFLDNALANLERADFVADIDDLDEFAQLVSLANGWLPPGRMSVLNPGKHPRSETQDLADEVPEAMVDLDLILYEAAKAKYRSWKQRVLETAAIDLWQQHSGGGLARPEGDTWELGFEGPLHGTNFHGREGAPPSIFRWMGPEPTSRLFVPVRPGFAQQLSVFIAAFIDPDVFIGLTYRINGVAAAPVCSVEENCTVATFAISPEDAASGAVELCITAPFTASDRDKGLGSDTRQKSMALRKIRVVPTPTA